MCAGVETRLAGKNRRQSAFTLVEVLIAIALIALAGALVVTSIDDLLVSQRTRSPYEVLRAAVDKAWFSATEGRGCFFLYYDKEQRCLLVKDENGMPEEVFPFEDELVQEVVFERTPDTGGGALKMSERTPFPFLVFSPHGGVTPATVLLKMSNESYRYRIEPFSAALEAEQ